MNYNARLARDDEYSHGYSYNESCLSNQWLAFCKNHFMEKLLLCTLKVEVTIPFIESQSRIFLQFIKSRKLDQQIIWDYYSCA